MITALYAALLALALGALSLNVIKARRKYGVALGDTTQEDILRQRIRAQGNFTEYTPPFLLMLLLIELQGLSVWLLHLIAVAFLVGRAAHAYAMLRDDVVEGNKLIRGGTYRVRAMQITFAVLIAQALILLYQFTFSFY